MYLIQATLRDLFQVKPDVQVTVQSDLPSDSRMETKDASWSSNCIEDVRIHHTSYNALFQLLGWSVKSIK